MYYEEEYKLAEPGGELDAYYETADAMAAELGIPTEDALTMADQALGSKIASDMLASHAIHDIVVDDGDGISPGLMKAAGYLGPSGPYAGIQNYLNNQFLLDY